MVWQKVVQYEIEMVETNYKKVPFLSSITLQSRTKTYKVEMVQFLSEKLAEAIKTAKWADCSFRPLEIYKFSDEDEPWKK